MSENSGPIAEGWGVASGSVAAAGCDWLFMVWMRRLASTGEQERLKVELYEDSCCLPEERTRRTVIYTIIQSNPNVVIQKLENNIRLFFTVTFPLAHKLCPEDGPTGKVM